MTEGVKKMALYKESAWVDVKKHFGNLTTSVGKRGVFVIQPIKPIGGVAQVKLDIYRDWGDAHIVAYKGKQVGYVQGRPSNTFLEGITSGLIREWQNS